MPYALCLKHPSPTHRPVAKSPGRKVAKSSFLSLLHISLCPFSYSSWYIKSRTPSVLLASDISPYRAGGERFFSLFTPCITLFYSAIRYILNFSNHKSVFLVQYSFSSSSCCCYCYCYSYSYSCGARHLGWPNRYYSRLDSKHAMGHRHDYRKQR